MWFFNDLRIQAFLLKVSILWPNKYNSPWVPTPLEEVHKMLQLAEVGPDDLVYDLGCGDGRLVVVAARDYGSRAVGIEIDPLRYLWCQLLITILGLRDRVQIIFGDFFDIDLGDANVVTCYLLPMTNEKLEDKFKQELQTNTRIVSNNFLFSGLQLQRKDPEKDLFLYHPEP